MQSKLDIWRNPGKCIGNCYSATENEKQLWDVCSLTGSQHGVWSPYIYIGKCFPYLDTPPPVSYLLFHWFVYVNTGICDYYSSWRGFFNLKAAAMPAFSIYFAGHSGKNGNQNHFYFKRQLTN